MGEIIGIVKKSLGMILQVVGTIAIILAGLASLVLVGALMVIPYVLCNLGGTLSGHPENVSWEFSDWMKFEWVPRKSNG